MSQDQPQPSEPEKTQPQSFPSETARNPFRSRLQKVTQALQQVWRQVQPVLKTQSIKTLRSTIQTLEGLLERLEAEEPPKTTESFLDKLRLGLQRIQAGWTAALGQIRTRLPESFNQKLSDQALTGAIAGLLIVVLWTSTALLPGKAPQVTTQPPADLTVPPELSLPASPKPVEVTPSVPVATPPLTPEPVVTSTPEPAVAPPPALVLDPEQALIASIQTQVAEVANQYAAGLIQLVQANFQSSQLIVQVSDDWYDLSQSQQDKLAAEISQRSQELDFSKLEVSDSHGALLARSPVVGTDMIILKRKMVLPTVVS
jgi:hypothetical protein